MGLLANQTQEDFDATTIEADAYELRDKGQRQADIANGLFAIGSTVILTGTILLLVYAFDDDLDEGPDVTGSVDGGAVLWRY